jgi:hypothetical protein
MPELRCYFCTSFVTTATIEGINENWDARYRWYRDGIEVGHTDVVGNSTIDTSGVGLENYRSSGNNSLAASTISDLSVTAPTITGYKSTYTLTKVAVFWYRSPRRDLEDAAIGTDGNYSAIDYRLRIYPSGGPITSDQQNGKLGRQFTNGSTITYSLNYSWCYDLIFLTTNVATVVTVIYYKNTTDTVGGTIPSRTDTPYPNQYTILGATQPTRTYYSILGWDTNQYATNATYTTNVNINHPATDTTINIYAVWKGNTHTFAYNANTSETWSGSLPASVTQDYPTQFTISGATQLNRTGYTNIGWDTNQYATSATYTTNVNINHPGTTSTTTLYAIWQIINYTVEFRANGKGTGKNVTQAYNTPVSLPTLKAVGWTFNGWATTNTASTANVTAGFNMPVNGRILYAVWTENTNGEVRFSELQTVWGDTNPISISEYQNKIGKATNTETALSADFKGKGPAPA